MTLSSHTWDMPWQEIEAVLGIRQNYHLRNLNISDEKRCQTFLKNCGFQSDDENHIRQFEQLLGEALFFIRHTLLTEKEREKIPVPKEILQPQNPSEIILLASSYMPRQRYKRIWACAVLKVMYALANIQYSGKIHTLNEAREQIFKKIKDLIVNENKPLIQFNNISLPLEVIEWKESKTRTSIIMKLLHKPDSILDEVFDYLGVRMVVKKTSDLPILLKLLIDSDVIIPHQVVSARTKNSLFSIKQPKKILTFLKELQSSGTLTQNQFEKMSAQIHWKMDLFSEQLKKANYFTSEHYRSLQITVRHLIRSTNPAYVVLESLVSHLKRYTGSYRQEPWIGSVIPEQYTNYFPIEIQIMDKESYAQAKFGKASHEKYKANQLKAVRNRVLLSLINFDDKKWER